jgi:glycerol-3-phosphate acyltransferase PlsY
MKIVFMGSAPAAEARIATILPNASGLPVLAALLLVAGAYLIGSVSFAVVVSRAFRLPDPHEYGSGNPGATNVLRTGHRLAALLTLVGDGAKGFVAVFAVRELAPLVGAPDWVVPAAALAVFLGHLYPLFHGFRGGKGVATAAGVVLALYWPLGVVLIVVWLTMAFGFKISSLAALITAVLLPLGLLYAKGPGVDFVIGVVMAALLFWRHRTNIRSLMSGRERTIGQ